MSCLHFLWPLVLAPLFAACAPGLPQPTSTHLAAAQRDDPSTTLEDLSRGRSAYAAKCGSCHGLRAPESVPAAQWPAVVREMQEKQGVRLTPQENRDILRYLEAVASGAP